MLKKKPKKLPKVRIVWFKADFDINIFHHHSLSAVTMMMMSRRRKSSSCLQTQTGSSLSFPVLAEMYTLMIGKILEML